MASVQRMFPMLTVNALSFLRKPTSGLGQWEQVSAVYSAEGARYIGPVSGTVQQLAAPRFNAVPATTTQRLLLGQFVGDPLRSTLIPAATWNVGFALQLSNAGATYQWQGQAALFVLSGTTGQRRATIFDTSDIGSGGRTATGELSCLDSIAGQAVQVRAGDSLCLELGIKIANAAGALAPQVLLYSEGTQPITADNVAISSAQTVLESPVDLLLSLPQAGEQPGASVTFADANHITKELWPPRSGSLYDWDNSEALVCKIFQALSDSLKLYFFDQSDRLFREVNPLTTVELLPTWEGLLGITLSEGALRTRSVTQRRNAMLARLREMGPLTVHALAAIFATLASYVPPAAPEVLELGRVDMEGPNTYTDAIGGAIPVGTAFDATNLIRITPTLLDGGVCWDAGALLTLNLSAATSSALHIQLTAPDLRVATWSGGPDLTTALKLRSPEVAGSPTHGNWTLNLYRDAGSPAVSLTSWSLYALGKRWGGRGGQKRIWSIYLDAAHQALDRRDIDTTLDRITQSYAEGFCVFDKTSIPGTNTHRAGRFIPGA